MKKKNRTIKLQDGDAALVIDKNCTNVALHEDVENDDDPVGSNTYLLMALILATRNDKLVIKILNHAEKVLKNKTLEDVVEVVKKVTKKGRK